MSRDHLVYEGNRESTTFVPSFACQMHLTDSKSARTNFTHSELVFLQGELPQSQQKAGFCCLMLQKNRGKWELFFCTMRKHSIFGLVF